ncbi:CCR4-NOT transcription complex subunit 10 isoform X2 [Oratosquilla oratoria]|uniref:CCR4-NOT transcription complex subunit 10 isoform X2 n=1 Tax=Oratosquilla oratoria TaxID=337810 RepID=UPI003F7592E7
MDCYKMAETKNTGEGPQETLTAQENAGDNDTTDAEKDWAQTANTEFSKGNYTAALNYLCRLESSRPKDYKVLLNKAVVEYYKGDMMKTDAFRLALKEIATSAGINIENIGSIDDVEQCVFYLNHCVLLYHLQQYRTAIAILEKMFTCLESLEESVGTSVCLLLIECHLQAQQCDRALAAITHTETTFLPQPLPPAPSPKQQDKDTRSPEKGPAGSNGGNSGSGGRSGGSGEVRCSATQEQLRGKLQQLRVRALLMMHSLRITKKELKNIGTQAMNSGNSLNITLVCLKSQLEYLRGNHRKAIKVINQCAALPTPSPTCRPSLGVVYYNNLGVIHFGLSKPTVACLYLQKALQEVKGDMGVPTYPNEPFSNRPLYQLGSRVKWEIYYNLGITLLHMNKPDRAFTFLMEVIKVHTCNPRLWLRIAECCIAQHKMVIEDDGNKSNLRKSLVQGVVGVGAHRKICLSMSISGHNKRVSEMPLDANDPEMSLEFARLCLRNAISLLPDNISISSLTDEQEASGVLPELYQASPSSPMRGNEVLSVRVSALACSAYVSLCLSDFTAALRQSEALLTAHPKIPGVYKLLGHLYAGEALICLGRVSEAMTHLDPRHVGEISLTPSSTPPPIQDTSSSPTSSYNQGWYPGKTSAALQVMRYNLSVAYTLRGELDKANNLLKEVWNERSGNVPAQVIMLAMYIQLQMGHADVMKNMVKKHILLT